MGACVQCRFDVPEAAASCPRCGAQQVKAPSIPAPASSHTPTPVVAVSATLVASGHEPDPPPAARSSASALAVPDLDLPVAPPAEHRSSRPPPARVKLEVGTPAPAKAQTAARGASTSAAPASGPDFDDDDNVSLQLDVAVPAPSARSAPAIRSASASPARTATAARSSIPPPPGRSPSLHPGGHRSGRASLPPPGGADTSDLDPYEIKRIADFGDPPEMPWEAVLYALRVHQRRNELRAQLEPAQQAVSEREKQRDEALAAALRSAHQELLADAATARMFEPAREPMQRYEERKRALDEAQAQARRDLEAIDAELAQHEQAAQEGRSVKASMTKVASELFDAIKAAEKTSSADADAKRKKLDTVRDRMTAADDKATAAIARMQELRRRRREQEAEHESRVRVMSQALADADKALKAAMFEAGRELSDGNLKLSHPAFASVETVQQQCQAARLRLRTIEAAMNSYDRRKIQIGVGLLIATTLLVIGSFIFGIYRMREDLSVPPPPPASPR